VVGGGRAPGGGGGCHQGGRRWRRSAPPPPRPRSSLPPSRVGGVPPAQRSASAAAFTAAAAAVTDVVRVERSPRPAAVAAQATAVRPPTRLPAPRWGWRRGRSADGPPPGHASLRRCGRPPPSGGAGGRRWSAMHCRLWHWRGRPWRRAPIAPGARPRPRTWYGRTTVTWLRGRDGVWKKLPAAWSQQPVVAVEHGTSRVCFEAHSTLTTSKTTVWTHYRMT